MGDDAYAMLIVGIEVKESDFETKTKKRGCAHEHKHKHCPECGAKAWIEKTENLPGWNEDSFNGLDAHFPNCEGHGAFIIGETIESIATGEGYADIGDRTRDIAVAKDKVMKALVGSPFADRHIGVWLMLRESC